MANSKKLFEVIGTAALVWAIYKAGEIKGSLATGLNFAKHPEKGEQLNDVIEKTKGAIEAVGKGQKVDVKVTKDTFDVEVTEPAEEAEEIVSEDETTDQPED